jgi:hypothetical protein
VRDGRRRWLDDRRTAGRAAAAAPALAGLVLGALAIGPGLAPGFVLAYDMVFVPSPPLSPAAVGLTGTLPRAVPSDAVVDVLSRAIPADIVQKLILLAIFVLACSGAAAVLRGRPLAARLAAGVFYAWNPFVAERLLIGQWALLLGYCGLPWLIVAFQGPPPKTDGPPTGQPGWRLLARLGCALIPAAVGGFSAMLISALVIIPVALSRRWARTGAPGPLARRAQAMTGATFLLAVLVLLTVLSLPWLVPSLLRQVHTDPAGVNAFAARADTPFGSFGSLLALGGVWNAQVVPPGYAGAATVLPLCLSLTGLTGYALGCRREPFWRGLGVAAVIGLAVASIGVTPAGRAGLRSLVGAWPGFAVLRDGQQFVAPLALAGAIGLGGAVSWAMRAGLRPARPAASRMRALASSRADGPAMALGLLGVIAPVLLLPGLAWGAGGRLDAVRYPATWLAARQAIDADPAPGSVLVLPYAAYRRYQWNDSRTMLDPWPRLLRRQAIWNDAVQIGNLQLAPEDPEGRRLSPLIHSGAPLARPLQAAGVRYVIIDSGLGGIPAGGTGGPAGDLSRAAGGGPTAGGGPAVNVPRLEARLRGATPVLAGAGLVVYRLPAPAR